MKRKWQLRSRMFIGLLLALAITGTSCPTLASELAKNDASKDAVSDPEYVEEEMPEQEDDSILYKSIEDYTDKDRFEEECVTVFDYDGDGDYDEDEDVSDDELYAQNTYTIVYNRESGTELVENAQEIIDKCGNSNITLKDGVVNQTFERGSQDKLAPLVYSKTGKVIEKGNEWYVNYTKTTIGTGGRISKRTVKVYFSADTDVRDLQSYNTKYVIELFPNWINGGQVVFDEESLKGANNPNDISVYEAGKTIVLKPITDKVTGMKFDGWEYQFGTRKSQRTQNSISTTNMNETLTIRALWKPVPYVVFFDKDSFRGVSNPNSNITSYVTGDIIKFTAPTGEVEGYTFGGFKYKYGDDGKKLEAVKEEDGSYTINTEGCEGDLTIYANYKSDKIDVVFDEESLKGTVNPNADIVSYDPGKVLRLKLLDYNDEGYPRQEEWFLGWSYQFADDDEGFIPAKQESYGSEEVALIPTEGHSGTLTIKAVWYASISKKTPTYYYMNEANLVKKATEAGIDAPRVIVSGAGTILNNEYVPKVQMITSEKDSVASCTRTPTFSSSKGEFVQIGWAFSAEPENDIPDALYSYQASDMSWLQLVRKAFQKDIYHGDEDKSFDLYAIWGYRTYKITYEDIMTDKDLAAVDEDGHPILPREYNTAETVVLPDAEGMDKLPDFSKRFKFNYWTTSSKYENYRVIKRLGKDGDIKSGNVRLYAARDSKVGTNEDDLPYYSQNEKTFVADMTGYINILYKDDPFVITLCPLREGLRADSRYAQVLLPEDKDKLVATGDKLPSNVDEVLEAGRYWTVCPVDHTTADCDYGNTTIGVKLSDYAITKAQEAVDKNGNNDDFVKDMIKNRDRIYLRIRGINEETGKLEDHYSYEQVRLSFYYESRNEKYKLSPYSVTAGVLKDDNGKEIAPQIKVQESTGLLALDKKNKFKVDNERKYWSYTYCEEENHVKTPSDKLKFENYEYSWTYDEFIVSIDRSKFGDEDKTSGYLKISNNKWLPGSDCYCPFSLTLRQDTERPKLKLSKTMIYLNRKYDTEKDRIYFYFDGLQNVPQSYYENIEINTEGLPKNISVKRAPNHHSVEVKIDKANKVKKGTYYLEFIDKGAKSAKPVKLTIKVDSATQSGAATFTLVGGRMDAIAESRLYYKVKVKGFAGDIDFATVKKNDKCPTDHRFLYNAAWDGNYVIVAKNNEYVYQKGGYEETIRLTMDTGNYVYGKVKIIPQVGRVDLEVPRAQTIYAGDADPEAKIPVKCTYWYEYYLGPRDSVTRAKTININKDTIKYQSGERKYSVQKLMTVGSLSYWSKSGVFDATFDDKNDVAIVKMNRDYKKNITRYPYPRLMNIRGHWLFSDGDMTRDIQMTVMEGKSPGGTNDATKSAASGSANTALELSGTRTGGQIMDLSKVKVRQKYKDEVCVYNTANPSAKFEPEYELYYTTKIDGEKMEIVLAEGIDYTCTYSNNTKPGKATVTFTAADGSDYTGTKTQKFTIKLVKTDIGTADGIEIEFPNGSVVPFEKGGVKPEVIVTYYGMKLKEGQDYTLSYSNNKSANPKKTPKVTVKGKGYFKGKKDAEFEIEEENRL